MGAGVVKPQDGTPRPNSVRIHVAAAPSFSTTSTSFHSSGSGIVLTGDQDMSCESCSTNFTVFKRKKSCRDCGRNFCQDCVQKFLEIGNRRRSFRQCKNCSILMSGNFCRQDLMKWKVKDLRVLLNRRNISTETCTEKPDLIDLLFLHFGNNSNRTAQDNMEHSRHVDELVERMRDTISEIPSLSSETTTNTPSQGENQGQGQAQNETQGQGQDSNSSNTQQNQNEGPTTIETEEERRQRLQRRQQEELRAAENILFNVEQEDQSQQTTGNQRKRMKVDDIKDIDQIDNLSVQQLKELLVTNFVDYKGCVEKYELMDRVRRLWKEHQLNKKKVEEVTSVTDNPKTVETSKDNEDEICKICMDAAIDCVLLECGHMVSCTQCGRRLAECPLCRQFVVRAVHVFKT